jgi:hypothetical protein
MFNNRFLNVTGSLTDIKAQLGLLSNRFSDVVTGTLLRVARIFLVRTDETGVIYGLAGLFHDEAQVDVSAFGSTTIDSGTFYTLSIGETDFEILVNEVTIA